MKQFIIIKRTDKKHIKMINQAETGFELVITSNSVLNEFIKKINFYKENNYDVDIVWQMKFKNDNYIIYKNCIFSNFEINYFNKKGHESLIMGEKVKVSCSGVQYYSDSYLYKNRIVNKTKHIYKDGNILNRILKIGELNSKVE